MNGVALVDKPQGMTSFDVVRLLRRFCGTRQVGHCGTLDPMATGLLTVAIGSATRLVEYLMADEKEYLATLLLGTVTDTQDSTGEVVETHSWQEISHSDLLAACGEFTGTIAQIPPMYSALKRDGVPLYKLARQGVEVERAPRTITISLLDILEFSPPLVSLRVVCSKGTYIRTLAHDLGRHLGCGATLTALRRVRCGVLDVREALALEAWQSLAETCRELPLLSPLQAMAGFPAVIVKPSAWGRLANGVAPALDDVNIVPGLSPGDLLCLQVNQRLAAVAGFSPGGDSGRSGDFTLHKVFPDAFLEG